jgi:uncharacterized protein YutE (UPF0331/DUF86 family)
MTIDRQTLAERLSQLERHLARVAACLPAHADDLKAMTDAGDAVVLHLGQATQITMDVAISTAVRLKLGTPRGYAHAFRMLAEGGVIAADLGDRLVRAAGFRNMVVHAYGALDMRRVWQAACNGPDDLRALFAAVAGRL